MLCPSFRKKSSDFHARFLVLRDLKNENHNENENNNTQNNEKAYITDASGLALCDGMQRQGGR